MTLLQQTLTMFNLKVTKFGMITLIGREGFKGQDPSSQKVWVCLCMITVFDLQRLSWAW